MNYDKLVKALRHCVSDEKGVTKCAGCPYYPDITGCIDRLHTDAAAAIEALDRLLDQNTQRCEALRKQLREAHESYEKHLNELEAQLPKRGEIVRCRECRWGHLCVMGQHLGLDGFCSKGEREVQE